VGPKRRGLALGLNECSGYVAVGVTSWVTGYIAASSGLRPAPFYLGIGVAVIGLLTSIVFVRETHGHARVDSSTTSTTACPGASTHSSSRPTGSTWRASA
jgi:hypothetical protein